MNDSAVNRVNPEFSPLRKLISALLVIVIGGFIFSGLFLIPVLIMDFDISSIIDGNSGAITGRDLNILRYMLIVEQVAMFALTGIFVLRTIYPSNDSLRSLKVLPEKGELMLLLALSIAMLPLTSISGILNEGMQFPDWMSGVERWMREKENSANSTIEALVLADTYPALMMNIVIVAVLPAFCEEIVFRAVFQRGLQEVFRSGNLAVWVTSIIFSAIHFQFYGFIPRLIIGLILGYLFLWSRSLWLPVIIHFLNNLIPILGAFFFDMAAGSENSDYPFWQLAGGIVLPGLIVILIMMNIKSRYNRSLQSIPNGGGNDQIAT